ncbi:hypothetical protein ACH4LN_28795 [Streptomyces albus]|uniref:hypothetical protein n=1 Tax=Streptomyces albus TaxID=1888 RepID=UPI0037AE57C2
MARRSPTPAPAPGGSGPRSRSRTPVPVRTRRTAGDIVKAFCAFVALAALVVGVPLALASVMGWPLPRRMPDWDMLRDEVGVGTFVDVLTVVVWLAWAQFTACVLVEVKAAVSGVGLPARVPGAGPSQLLARQLVAALLLLGSSTASFAPGLSQLGHAVQPHQPSMTVAAAALTPGERQAPPGADRADGTGPGTMGASGPGTALVAAADGAGTVRQASAGNDVSPAGHTSAGTKFYRIQPPEGRHHDSLWEIAERHLGDGRRYKEIYRLNKDRAQPDGSRLSEASLIRPGWIMEMPADAHGGELVEMPDDTDRLDARERAEYERYRSQGGGHDAGDGGRQESPARPSQPDGPDRQQDGQGDGKQDDGKQDGRQQRQEDRRDEAERGPGPDEEDVSVPDGTAVPDGTDHSDHSDSPDRAEQPKPSEAGPSDPSDQPDEQPSVPDSSSTDRPALQPDRELTQDDTRNDTRENSTDRPALQPDRDLPQDDARQDPREEDSASPGGDSTTEDTGPDGNGPGETVEVAPDEHAPDRQAPSVPETSADGQSTRPDSAGRDDTGDTIDGTDGTDDDGLPGPGIAQPDDIRPGATGDDADTPDDGGSRPDTDDSATPSHPRGGEDHGGHPGGTRGSGREGTADDGKGGGGDDTPSDLAHADTPGADGGNRLDRSGQAAADEGGAPGPVGLPEALIGAPLLAAGLLAALGSRRRAALWRAVTGGARRAPADDFAPPSDPAARAQEALLAGADPGAVRFLDRALRGLAEDLAEAGRPLPVVYAAWLTGQDLHLQLAEEAGAPPAPWRFGQSATFWTIQRAHTRIDVDTEAPPPYPALVSLGLRGEARLLLNLESVPGLVSVAGDAAAREAVLASIAAELATGSWSKGLGLTLVGFGAELTALAPDRVRHLPDVAALLREREGGAVPRRGDTSQVVLIGAEPTDEEAHRLAALTTGGEGARDGFVVGVPGGRLPSVVWEFEIDEEGTLAARRMGLEVRAQLLPEELRAAVVALFADADETGTGDGEGPGFRVDLSESGRPAVYARLMGDFDLTGVEAPEESRSALLHEALALLLLNRDGVHPRVLASALWPKGVTDDVRDALVDRLRDWLGIETDGTPRLVTGADGRLALRPSVVCDWDVLRTLHHGCTGERGARLAPRLRRAQLADALSLARGPLLADRPEGRYGWLAHHVAEAQHPLLVADLGLALAAEHLRAQDPDAAVEAVRAALRTAPDDERLWDELVRVAHATEDAGELDAAVRWVVERGAALHGPERGVSPRTAALLDELAPGWTRTG